MASNVKMLDCTLRDGGYVNDWDFGHSVITGTYKRLDEAGIDYIEVGFLDDRRPFDMDRTIMPDTDSLNKVFANVPKKHAIPVAMIDYGTCSIDNIGPCSSTFIDGIRVIFKKEKIDEALPFCQAIKDKGYKLFIQAISITAYSDMELLEYVQKINRVKPYAFSIVDTYGLLDNASLARYFYLIDNNLSPDVRLGYHDHNNFQLGFSNTAKFLSFETKRELIADATVYGMGKSAGNCTSELLAMHMNDRHSKNYNLNLILEIIDTDLMSIYQKHYWGYKYDFFIAAMQKCHPNYVKHLLDKKALSISSINEILAKIPESKKLHYDKDWMETAYLDYQKRDQDDHLAYLTLAKHISPQKKALILGPGRTITTHSAAIKNAVDDDTVVLSANFWPKEYAVDFVFISSAKRYSKLADVLHQDTIDSSLILTSNISTLPGYSPDFVLNYESLLWPQVEKKDNTLFLLLSMLHRLGVTQVFLAGFDGFGNGQGDYYQRAYEFSHDQTEDYNATMQRDLALMAGHFDIHFLTPSYYRQ